VSTRRARITDLLERVVTALGQEVPPDATDPTITVTREYVQEYLNPDYWKDNPSLASSFTGRRLYVFGLEQSQVEATTRATDRNEYRVTVVTVERYESQRDVADKTAVNDWLDERVEWVERVVYDHLGDHTRDRPAVLRAFLPAAKEWVKVYDYDLLRTLNVFLSAVVIAFHRWE
jgi:hypothetical protein